MPKYIITRVRTVETVEFREVEAPSANEAQDYDGPTVRTVKVRDSQTGGPVMDLGRADDFWMDLVVRLKGSRG